MISRRLPRPRTASGQLFAVAVLMTLVVLSVGQAFMYQLYSSDLSPRPAAMPSANKDSLTIGVGRTPGGPDEWISYARVLSRLQTDLRQPVRVRYAMSRQQAQDLVASGDTDAAFVSTYRYLQLERAGEATLVAAPIIAGQTHDAAIIVVAAASRFADFESLRGSTVILAPPESLGGYSYLYWLFEQRGENPSEFFSSVEQAASQDHNLGVVLRGEADATSVNRSALASWPRGSFRILSASPEYGMPPLVARSDMPPELIESLRESLTVSASGVRQPTYSQLQGFTVPDAVDYEFARVLMRFFENQKRDAQPQTSRESQ